MRALGFTKIDYIKTKQQLLFIPAYLVFISFLSMMSPKSDVNAFNAATIFLYMVFITIVFSTTPFGTCQRQENGFLLLLPATTHDRVLGRFLYGLSLMAIAVACSIVSAMAYRAAGRGFSEIDLPVCLIGLAVGLVMMAVEYVFMYLFGENWGQSLLAIVRIAPGMSFFFITMNLSKEILIEPEGMQQLVESVGDKLMMAGYISVAVAAAVFAGAVALCVKVAEKRDN